MSERNSQTYREQVDAQRILWIREIAGGLPEACGDFLRFIALTTSTFTRLAYALDLRTFFNYLHDERLGWADKQIVLLTDADLARLTTADLNAYTEYLTYYLKKGTEEDPYPREVTNHELAIKRKLCSIRALYEYLFQMERIPGNIAELVPLPKLHEKPIIRLSGEEMQRLLHTAETGEGLTRHQQAWHRNTAVRDYAMLMLFLGTGIRVSECVGLNLSDVDFRERAFVVTRKGGNQMVLYFNEEVAEALEKYMAEREKIEPLPGHEQAFFLSLQRKRINLRTVQMLVKKYAAVAAPLKPRISPHKLRSTFATNLYRETGDIYLVADVLGHSSVDTTRKHYADMTDRRRRAAAGHVHLLSGAEEGEELPARAAKPAAKPAGETRADTPPEAGQPPEPRRRRRAAQRAEETAPTPETGPAPEAEEPAKKRHRRTHAAEEPSPAREDGPEAPAESRRRRARAERVSPPEEQPPEEQPAPRRRRAQAEKSLPPEEKQAPSGGVRHRRSHRP